MNEDIKRVLLHICEAESKGHIDEYERDELLTVLEMKTKGEYRKASLKKRFKFQPSKNDPNKGTIIVDGEPIKIDIGNAHRLKTNYMGGNSEVDRMSCCVTAGGEVILSMNEIVKLRNKHRIDAAVYHEIGHHKLHAVDIDQSKFRTTNSDSTLSDTVINAILDELREARIKRHKQISDKDIRVIDRELSIVKKYLIQKLKNSNPDPSMQELRKEAIEYYKSISHGGHSNWKEFEADRYAANKVGDGEMIKSIKEYYKKNPRKGIGNLPENIQKQIRDDDKRDMNDRISALRDKNTGKYRDVYKKP